MEQYNSWHDVSTRFCKLIKIYTVVAKHGPIKCNHVTKTINSKLQVVRFNMVFVHKVEDLWKYGMDMCIMTIYYHLEITQFYCKEDNSYWWLHGHKWLYMCKCGMNKHIPKIYAFHLIQKWIIWVRKKGNYRDIF